jgi:hypothetical protein
VNKVGLDKYMDFDVARVASERYFENQRMVETAPEIILYKKIAARDEFIKMVGAHNTGYIRELVRGVVKRDQAEVLFERNAVKIIHKLRMAGMGLALKGVSQLATQSIPALGNAWIRTKSYKVFTNLVDVYTNPAKVKLLSYAPISTRGKTKLSVETFANAPIAKKIKLKQNEFLKKAAYISKGVFPEISEALWQTLVFSDVTVAKSSWIVDYGKFMKRQGFKVQDQKFWEQQAEHPNEYAITYAESQSTRNYNQNTQLTLSNMYKGNSAAGLITKDILFAYQSVPFNQRMKITNDLLNLNNAIKTKDLGQINIATTSLLSSAVEIVAFNGIKALVLSPLITAGASVLLNYYNVNNSDKRDDGKKKMDADKKFIGMTLNDILWGGTGVTQPMLALGSNYTANFLYNMLKEEGTEFKPFYYYKPSKTQTNNNDFGIYGTLISKGQDVIVEIPYAMGKATKRTGKNQTEIVNIQENEKQLAQKLLIFDAISLVSNITDRDLLRMGTIARKSLQNQIQTRLGGKMFLIESNAKKTKPISTEPMETIPEETMPIEKIIPE